MHDGRPEQGRAIERQRRPAGGWRNHHSRRRLGGSTLPGVGPATAGTSVNMGYVPVYVRALINSWTGTTSTLTASVEQGAVSA